MRVLVVDGSGQDRELTSRHLQSAGHQVMVAGGAKAALAAMERELPEVLVLDAQLQGMTSLQLVQRMRTREHASRVYSVLVSSKPSISELTSSIAAGADDYMRKPLHRDELIIRVGALDRIRAWTSKIFESTGGRCVDLAEKTRWERLQAWQHVDGPIRSDVAELLGQSLAPMAADDVLGGCVLCAQMALTLAAEQTEVRLTVGVEASVASKLAALCLGDADAPEDSVRDVLRELANTAGGAFVRAAVQEGVSLTHGLPVDVSPASFAHPRSGVLQRFVLVTRDASVRIHVELEILSKALRRVSVGQLVEGMVLARDLHTDAGAMLVPGGTRLTGVQIERLGRILSTRVTFDVAEAA